jgi:diguanylate cyclase (GGDEF)-like protein
MRSVKVPPTSTPTILPAGAALSWRRRSEGAGRRGGGEEFALLASHTTLEGAVALAEKLRLAISRARCSVSSGEGLIEIEVTASLGVAAFRGDEKGFFNDADRALYRAKSLGKDCVVVADAGD